MGRTDRDKLEGQLEKNPVMEAARGPLSYRVKIAPGPQCQSHKEIGLKYYGCDKIWISSLDTDSSWINSSYTGQQENCSPWDTLPDMCTAMKRTR